MWREVRWAIKAGVVIEVIALIVFIPILFGMMQQPSDRPASTPFWQEALASLQIPGIYSGLYSTFGLTRTVRGVSFSVAFAAGIAVGLNVQVALFGGIAWMVRRCWPHSRVREVIRRLSRPLE
jgi:hypothetical protein